METALQHTQLSQQPEQPKYTDIRGATLNTVKGRATVICPIVGGVKIRFEDGSERSLIWDEIGEVLA